LRQVQDFYRLYMAPGMTHCGGGVGANVFGNFFNSVSQDPEHDVLSALEQWVETGIAPEEIEATKYIDNDRSKGVAFTRPLCPYPQRAVYRGWGNVNDAANFECRRRGSSSKPLPLWVGTRGRGPDGAFELAGYSQERR
jgi:feruloyl esterase